MCASHQATAAALSVASMLRQRSPNTLTPSPKLMPGCSARSAGSWQLTNAAQLGLAAAAVERSASGVVLAAAALRAGAAALRLLDVLARVPLLPGFTALAALLGLCGCGGCCSAAARVCPLSSAAGLAAFLRPLAAAAGFSRHERRALVLSQRVLRRSPELTRHACTAGFHSATGPAYGMCCSAWEQQSRPLGQQQELLLACTAGAGTQLSVAPDRRADLPRLPGGPLVSRSLIMAIACSRPTSLGGTSLSGTLVLPAVNRPSELHP